MKIAKCSIVVPVLCVYVFSGWVFAAEPGVPRGALLEAKDLSRWSVGVGFEMADRLADGTVTGLFETRNVHGMLSYDPTDWLTLSVGAGQTETKTAPLDSYGDGGFMWMAGARLNAWQYVVKDPTFLVSRIRIQGAASYWVHDTDVAAVDTEWNETRASVLLCVEFFADGWGDDKSVVPYSTALYVGPVLSRLDADDVRIEEVDDLGLEVELDIYLAHSFSLGYHYRTYDDFEYATHTINVALHF